MTDRNEGLLESIDEDIEDWTMGRLNEAQVERLTDALTILPDGQRIASLFAPMSFSEEESILQSLPPRASLTPRWKNRSKTPA